MQLNQWIFLGVLIWWGIPINGFADVSEHLKKLGPKVSQEQIPGIDFIYLINLDKRPDRLEKSLTQLAVYNIYPYRFSAIYGKDLSYEDLNEVGLVFQEGMCEGQWVRSPSREEGLEYEFLREECYGKTVFSRWMTQGAIGCALSHLSILQDAWDSGYETIWVMEDDVFVKENPHQLGDLIEKLDALVGDWDILYTDDDGFGDEIPGPIWWAWRPDMPIDSSLFGKRTKIDKDFMKIKSRTCTYSMIIRRSGMRKILEFIKQHHIFLPYDHDFSFIEEIQLYMLNFPVVAYRKGESSDVQPFSPL